MKFDGNSIAHLHAFQLAIERADLFLREDLKGNEVGTIYAEDCPNMRETLRTSGLMYREPWGYSRIPQRPSESERRLGVWSYKEYRIDHIVEQSCFVSKRESPLLQLADACAFSFRRYFSGKEHGEDLVYAMLGRLQTESIAKDDRWMSGPSSGLFRMKNHTPERPSIGN